MYLWVDDIRKPPIEGAIWAKTVGEAITAIWFYERNMSDDTIIIDLDHDAGDYACRGGDYIKLLDWLEEKGKVDKGFFFRLHTMNPVGRENMRRVIERNGWEEIK